MRCKGVVLLTKVSITGMCVAGFVCYGGRRWL